jgi:hypothetical protein
MVSPVSINPMLPPSAAVIGLVSCGMGFALVPSSVCNLKRGWGRKHAPGREGVRRWGRMKTPARVIRSELPVAVRLL